MVVYPVKAMKWCSVKTSKLLVLVTLSFSFIYTIPNFFSARLVNNQLCLALPPSSTFYRILSYINIFFNCVVCFTILVVLNAGVLRALRKRELAVGNQPLQSRSKTSTMAKRQQELPRLLPVVTLVFLFLTLPVYKCFIVNLMYDVFSSPVAYAYFFFVTHFSNKLFYSNNAVNFLLYVAYESKFRNDIKLIFIRMFHPN